MTETKRIKLAKILGYIPNNEQLKAIEELFTDYQTKQIIEQIREYDEENMLGIQDTLFIKKLKKIIKEDL